jgi:hypothetical protein
MTTKELMEIIYQKILSKKRNNWNIRNKKTMDDMTLEEILAELPKKHLAREQYEILVDQLDRAMDLLDTIKNQAEVALIPLTGDWACDGSVPCPECILKEMIEDIEELADIREHMEKNKSCG